MENHSIYWWNLENLFDIENSPRRSSFLENQLKKELKGWNQNILNQKIDNLSSIIIKFNTNNGPDILGVCEVENEHVLKLLTDKLNSLLPVRSYSFIIIDGEDKRGIDTALIYDKNKYTVDPKTFTLRISKRNPTRDLFQIQLTTQSNNTLVLILNHWPSRSGGKLESEPFRMMVAENLSYWVKRIHEELGKDISILLMGDFNDNPFNRSMTDYLQSSNIRKKVMGAKNHFFYNPMFRFLDKNIGTHVYGNEVNILDQFLISKSILNQSNSLPFKVDSVEIIDFPELSKGKYKTPIRFGRPKDSKGINPNGYSDHLPISITLKEK